MYSSKNLKYNTFTGTIYEWFYRHICTCPANEFTWTVAIKYPFYAYKQDLEKFLCIGCRHDTDTTVVYVNGIYHGLGR